LGAVGPGVRPVALTPAKRYSKAMAKTNLEEGEWFMPAPEDACRTCGGRGVIGPVDQLSGLYDGCDRCEGTGIDPDSPHFPL
jgi:DnaJ-class molecular chaperone